MTTPNDQQRSRDEFGKVFDNETADILASEFSSRSEEGLQAIRSQKRLLGEFSKSGRIGPARSPKDALGRFSGGRQHTQRAKAFAFKQGGLRFQNIRGRILQATPRSRLTRQQEIDIILFRTFYGRN